MPENDAFWDFYWEVRLREMEDLGKREAILAASKLIRSLSTHAAQPVRLLELGCGAGQIIGSLVEAHNEVEGIRHSVGIDYQRAAVEKCRRSFPNLNFLPGDFTDPTLLTGLGHFQLVLLVNALHEVFSAAYDEKLQEVNVPRAKSDVRHALAGAAACLSPGGFLVLFDGLEMPGDLSALVRIRFHHLQARRRFDTFVREYRPFRITVHETGDPFRVALSRRDFTRYIDKSIFLEKHLWPVERLESYQYFNETEFRQALAEMNMAIVTLTTLTVNEEKWRSEAAIETPGEDYPTEHILIIAQKLSDHLAR